MHSSVNTAPPKWAVERQLSSARQRLSELEDRLNTLLANDRNVGEVDGEITKVKDYIAELETWGHDDN
jgi:hypothetical protein